MAKRAVPPIVDGPITLRLLEPADLPLTRSWRNQDQIRKWFLDKEPISPDRHNAWFAQYRDRDDDFVFIIEEHDAVKRPIGQVSVYAIEWERGRAKFGRLMIGEAAARGRGHAKRAVGALIDHAERVFGIAELRLEVLAGNAPAIAIYEHCGFRVCQQDERELLMVRESTAGAQQ